MSTTLSPLSSVDLLTPNKIGNFTYDITFAIGILFLITALLLAAYLCARASALPPQPTAPVPRGTPDVETGLEEATVASYPTSRYSERARPTQYTATSCAICLADYKDGDELRQLPECGHDFHVKCIDPWLRLHASCPLCRTSPVPSPLAEVVPLARQAV